MKNILLILAFVLIFIYFSAFSDDVVREILGCFLLLLLGMMFWNWIVIVQIKFIIQEEQIVVKRGVIHKTINYMELYRVFDYQKKQNIIEVMLCIMNVVILSRDLTDKKLILFGISNDNEVIPEIRKRVERQKQLKNIHEFNNPF